MNRTPSFPRAMALVAALALAGCVNLAPQYAAPETETPVAFKEGQGVWEPAKPADTLERGPWWELFGDPVLNELVSRVEISNQTVAAAVASYAQARAVVAEQRAALWPTVTLNSSGTRSGGGGGGTRSTHQVNIGASWEPDVFGRLRLGVDNARAAAQASEADLAAARLAAQGEVATNYFNLREAEISRALQVETIAGYRRALEIVRNRYEVGVVARTDVFQAESQLANAEADLLTLERQRAVFEHAIAVLVGRAASNFSLPADPKVRLNVPGIPPELPSTLLQRRPDIAAAERRVAQANNSIGIARSGYFPNIRLTGSAGFSAASIGELFDSSSFVWSVGRTLAQTLFDAGATRARVEEARAQWEAASARYRNVVLNAIADVEDQLVALRVLEQQQGLRQRALEAAQRVEQQVLNRYRAGQVGYTEVITAQNSAASARRALVAAQIDRQVAAVALIQALGGGWRGL